MVNAALIDENAGTYSLEETVRRAGVSHKRADDMYNHLASCFGGEPNKKQMANYWRLSGDDPIGVGYARQDGVATWLLHAHQQKQIKEQELELVHSVECRVLKTLFEMERTGVKVDEERLQVVRKKIQGDVKRALKSLPPEFNVRSTPQILKLYESKGISGFPTTEKGNPSFTESWLVTNEIGRSIVTVRKLSNLLNSFIDPLVEGHLFKGRVHTSFNQAKQDDYGVVTGRLSSIDPNMQQCPKRDKVLGPLFRSIFVPDSGLLWSANDYSQQEFRVFADYSGSRLLMDGYSADPPIDIHTIVANLLGVERDPTAKRMNLGLLYGMGKAKLADSLGCSIEQAVEWRDAHHEKLPEAQKFLKAAEYWARQRGWVRTKLKRRRRFPDPTLAHKAGNAIIQGTSADITKVKMVEISELFRKEKIGQLLLQVHDELDWQVPNTKEGRAVDAEARRIMTSFGEEDLITMKVPMAVDFRYGKNWSEATYGK